MINQSAMDNKPKRVKRGCFYYAIETRGKSGNWAFNIYKIREMDDFIDRDHFKSGNYFESQEQAKEYLPEFKRKQELKAKAEILLAKIFGSNDTPP